MKVQELTIVGPGPVGVDQVILSQLGIRNSPRARYYVDYLPAHGLLLAASVSGFVAASPDEGIWQLHSFQTAHTVVGGSGATVIPVVCPQAVAIASGVEQITAAISLVVTAPAKAIGTMIASPTQMTVGDWLGLKFAGTLTGLVGAWDMLLKRVG